MAPDSDDRYDPNTSRDAAGRDRGAQDSSAEDLRDEQIVRDAFLELPLVACPEDVTRRIEQALTENDVPLAGAAPASGRRRTPVRWLPVAGSVAAAAAIAWLLLAQSTTPPRPTVTQQDDLTALETRQGLALATQMLQRSEQILFEEALAKPLPGAVKDSLRKTISLVQGGRG